MRTRTSTFGIRHPRAGFSLVEMLVVLAIIALLSSISFVVLGKTGEAAREAATKTSIKILSGALRERVDGFHELTAGVSQIDPELPPRTNNRVFRETVAVFTRGFQYENPALNLHPLAAEAYVRKTIFKSVFPQREEDLYGYNGVLDNGGLDDSPMLTRMRDISAGTWKAASWKAKEDAARALAPAAITDDDLAESSELLYLILTEGDVYGLPASNLSGLDSNLIGDTDGDENLELLDGWGRPLQFYNWPTRLIKDAGFAFTGTVTVGANTYTTSSLLISDLPEVSTGGAVSGTTNRSRINRDPEDALRSLTPLPASTFFSLYTAAPATFNVNLNSVTVACRSFHTDYYHDPNTASKPLIVSAGSDGVLGLHLPTENGSSGTNDTNRLARVIATDEACQALGDNLTNQQRGPQ